MESIDTLYKKLYESERIRNERTMRRKLRQKLSSDANLKSKIVKGFEKLLEDDESMLKNADPVQVSVHRDSLYADYRFDDDDTDSSLDQEFDNHEQDMENHTTAGDNDDVVSLSVDLAVKSNEKLRSNREEIETVEKKLDLEETVYGEVVEEDGYEIGENESW